MIVMRYNLGFRPTTPIFMVVAKSIIVSFIVFFFTILLPVMNIVIMRLTSKNPDIKEAECQS